MPFRTYEADQSAKGQLDSPHATAADMGGQIGQALEGLGHDIEGAAKTGARLIKANDSRLAFAKRMDDTRWAGEAYEQEKLQVAQFMADPTNNTAEDYAQKLKKFTDERLGGYTSDSAPSSEALKMFKTNFASFANNRVGAAFDVGYRNKINNTITSVGSQTTDAITAYRANSQIPEAEPESDLTDSIAHIGAQIESNFRQYAPTTADSLHANLMTQAVLATLGDRPEYARALLNSTDKVDEHTRTTLNRQIDASMDTRNIVDRDAFNNFRKDAITLTEQGKGGNKLPLSMYQSVYPKDQAQVQKAGDDRYIDVLNRANGVVAQLAPTNADHVLAELTKLHKGINTSEDEQVYGIVAQKLGQALKMQETNPVGWLQQYNPQITRLVQDANDAPADKKIGAITALNAAVLKYQGSPPPDASEREKQTYLNRPLNDRHLMGTDEAGQTAADLNKSTPNEFIKKMGETLMRYPGDEAQYTAFNDLVTVPTKGSGLRQEYQLVWQNKDAWWLDTFVGALQGGKSITVPEKTEKELTSIIDADPTWMQFQSSMVGDSFQRSKQVAGFRQGIQAYSQALVSSGRATKEAANTAVKHLISETLGFTKVNGRPMAVLREQGKGLPMRTDEDVEDLGRRLGTALAFIDPREIDQSHFTPLREYGTDEMHLPRLQSLRDSITARAFFQTGNDGQSASLYYLDESGQSFQVRDRKGQPFNIAFKDLPSYQMETAGGMYSIGSMSDPTAVQARIGKRVPGLPETFPSGMPAKHYPLLKTADPYSREWSPTQTTNWPSTPSWMHHPTK